MVIHYNFNEYFHDGKDSIFVSVKDFKYKVKNKEHLTYDELYKKYRKDALEQAAYELMCEYADTMY